MHDDQAPTLDQRACNLRPVDLTELQTAHIPEQAYAMAGWLPYALVTLLSGNGGAGKSMLALIIAAHYACGKRWANIDVEQGRALYVSLEDSGNVVMMRLRRICFVYQLDFSKIARNLTIVDGSESEGSLFTESRFDGTTTLMATDLWSELQDAASGYRLIVVDNSSDAFSGNENDRRQVRAFLRQLAGMARENGAAVLLLAHIDKAAARDASKSNGQTFSGSTAWHNSARSRIALLPDGDTVTLVHEKLNGGVKSAPIALQWQASDGVLIPLRSEGAYGYQLTMQEADDTEILAAIAAAKALNLSIPIARTGPITAYNALRTIHETPKWAKVDTGKGRFWEAINRLERAGRLAQIDYRNSERKLKTRYEATL